MPTKKVAQPTPRTILILVGLPGSSKSTYAHSLSPRENWVIVNQDVLGDRTACISVAKAAIRAGLNVCVDRCNVTKGQRAIWINLAKQMKAEVCAVVFTPDPNQSIQNILTREDHPNLSSALGERKISSIVTQFSKTFEAPKNEEGIKSIIYVPTYRPDSE